MLVSILSFLLILTLAYSSCYVMLTSFEVSTKLAIGISLAFAVLCAVFLRTIGL